MKIAATIIFALTAAAAHAGTAADFPATSRAWLTEGAFIAPTNVREVRPGLTKAQVYPLLGAPHFGEGLGPRYWNYLINFYTGEGSEYVTCQLRLHFEHGHVDTVAWKDPACAERLVPKTAQTVAMPLTPIPARAETVIAQFPVYFAFDRAELNDAAHTAIATAASRAHSEGAIKVIVIGGADRTGSDSYNLSLSHRRAQAVADALAEAGVPASEAAAKGKYDLAVATAEGVREQANRRAVITLIR